MKKKKVKLIQDETVVYETGFNQFVFLQTLPYGLVLFGSVSILIFSFFFGSSINQSNQYLFTGVEGFLALIILTVAISQFMLWKKSYLIVTNKRIIYHIGWIYQNIGEIQLNELVRISVEQNLQGKILNYGKIIFHGNKDKLQHLSVIDNPFELKRRVFSLIHKDLKKE